jgi:hypothetical protein
MSRTQQPRRVMSAPIGHENQNLACFAGIIEGDLYSSPWQRNEEISCDNPISWNVRVTEATSELFDKSHKFCIERNSPDGFCRDMRLVQVRKLPSISAWNKHTI